LGNKCNKVEGKSEHWREFSKQLKLLLWDTVMYNSGGYHCQVMVDITDVLKAQNINNTTGIIESCRRIC
jgi:hypothetical protein